MTADDALDALLAHAEKDKDEGPVAAPVIPPGRMAEFADEWRRRPALRLLIRTVKRRPDLLAARATNREIAALAEMGESAAWRRRDVLDELADWGAEL